MTLNIKIILQAQQKEQDLGIHRSVTSLGEKHQVP